MIEFQREEMFGIYFCKNSSIENRTNRTRTVKIAMVMPRDGKQNGKEYFQIPEE